MLLPVPGSFAYRKQRLSWPRPKRPARALALMLLGCCASPVLASSGIAPLGLLPEPRQLAESGSGFRVGPQVRIQPVAAGIGAATAAAWLSQQLGLTARARGNGPAIRFVRVEGLPKEGYRLRTSPGGATISASSEAGFLYGAVTLWQLATRGSNLIPAVEIDDAPRFAWRGFMLDSARHFQSPQFIKTLIDAMAAHKLNVLHWHLTDDQGWRIEIPKYPRLTSVGAWRSPAVAPGAPPLPRIGGYYTQEQIREIVAYAASRNITIVPEIEMPGHALAAIRAYPELGTGVPIPAGIEADWGVYAYVYNVNDSTFRFLEDVLTDVMKLFPSQYIHVGGDEAVMSQWKASPDAQARMRSLGLDDERKLQSWFITRIEKFLNANGRKLIGWDEILEGGIAPNATVMSWRGIEGAITAAKAGHDTVLAPAPTLYLDHLQGTTSAEGPGRNKPITLENVYRFDPLPDAIAPEQQRHILGIQANLWTEHVRGDARAAHMIFPRLSALAEIAWRGEGGDFDRFVDRLLPQMDRLKKLGITPAASAFTPILAVSDVRTDVASIALSTQVKAQIRYTVDGTKPGPGSQLYERPLDLRLPTRLRAAAFRGRVALPGSIERSIDAETVRRRDDRELRQCSANLVLALEDDAPATGPRANFLSDILNPCWIYEDAPLDAVTRIDVDVGQVPFNFQLNNGKAPVRRPSAGTPAGELDIRIDGCEGERIASIPLARVTSPGITRLSAPVAPRTGARDLCLTFTGAANKPHWTIAAVQLAVPR